MTTMMKEHGGSKNNANTIPSSEEKTLKLIGLDYIVWI
jgi:hypothetical protein